MQDIVIFDPTLFRQQYPLFANMTTYPDATLQMNFDLATCYISPVICGNLGLCRENALYMMTAHITGLNDVINGRGTQAQTFILQGATIDKIQIQATPQPGLNGYNYWLGQTPWGQQLRALLTVRSTAGYYLGGAPERSAIRSVSGFGGGPYGGPYGCGC